MPRALWSGSISFGLVNVPVKLFAAKSEKAIRFNQIDRSNGARVRNRRVNESTGEEVALTNIVKGYEVAPDTYVTIEDHELEEFLPEVSRTIEIEAFVDLAEIDPVFFNSTYVIGPDNAGKAYKLLTEVMEQSRRVAIARFVMRSKQYVAVLRARDGALLLSTMTYPDELVDPAAIPSIAECEEMTVTDKELIMAKQLIESMTAEFDPLQYRDDFRERVLELIDRKAQGETLVPVLTPAPSAEKVVDLMAALEASVAAAREARAAERHSA